MSGRNDLGQKFSADRWRTFNGERFECWSVGWEEARVAAYRAAGLHVRKFEGETYMRPADFRAAEKIDMDMNR